MCYVGSVCYIPRAHARASDRGNQTLRYSTLPTGYTRNLGGWLCVDALDDETKVGAYSKAKERTIGGNSPGASTVPDCTVRIGLQQGLCPDFSSIEDFGCLLQRVRALI